MFALMEDTTQVFADHSERQQLRTAEEEHDDHDGRITAHIFSEEDRYSKQITRDKTT